MSPISCYSTGDSELLNDLVRAGKASLFRELKAFEDHSSSENVLMVMISVENIFNHEEISELIFRIKTRCPHRYIVLLTSTLEARLVESYFLAGVDSVHDPRSAAALLNLHVRAMLRTLEACQKHGRKAVQVLEFENMKLDVSSRSVTIDDKHVQLSGREFMILKILIEGKDQIVRSEEIVRRVWKGVAITQGNLHSQIYNLKKKLQGFSGRISTVHGVGLRIETNRFDKRMESEY